MTQLTFDWTRAEQLGLLERAVLPRQPGVSSVAMKAVLKAIDGYGRGREAFPGYQTLAQSAGVSIRVAKRAVAALEDSSLLCVRRQGTRTLNHYTIVWSELALLATDQRLERSATRAQRSATMTQRSATMTLPKCHHDTLNDNKRTKETTTTPETSELVVVVSNCGVARASEAVAKATHLGMSSRDIRQRVATWQGLPPERQQPGVLYNWLTIRGSYAVAKVAEHPQLRLAKLTDSAAQRRRADLIRYGRRQGWSHQKLQGAVQRFETELLTTTTQAKGN